jgi:two-component system CheB/CheR fusion protein
MERESMAHPRRLRILVVDDYRDTRKALQMVLATWGHEAQEAADGAEALRVAAEFKPDVVFLDLAMPGMTGLEVAQHLRQGGVVPVLVALTGHAGEAYQEAARAVGFDHFIAKPSPPEELFSLLERVRPSVEPGSG